MAPTGLQVDALEVRLPALSGGTVPIVDHVSLSVPRGRTLGLVGESGCGKTMTALAIMGLLPPGAQRVGAVSFDGAPVVRGVTASMVLQDPATALNPVLRVGDQIAETVRAHHRSVDADARAIALLEQVGIADAAARARAFPHQLSGGMRQRALLAAALASEPKLLIADEPTTALDVSVQAQVLAMLGRLAKERELALLLVTHDLHVAAEVCDQVAVMYAGRIVELAEVTQLFESPRHPYTKGLLDSRFRRGAPLQPMKGAVPMPGQWPSGCRFRERCPRATDVCAAQVPPLENGVACFHPLEGAP